MRSNHNMVSDHEHLVSDGKRKEGNNHGPVEIGIFHLICEVLHDSHCLQTRICVGKKKHWSSNLLTERGTYKEDEID